MIEALRESWAEDDPPRLERELAAMPSVAPGLTWDGLRWSGTVPLWPFERPRPAGLDSYVGDRRLSIEISYYESFPMVAPRFVPIDPRPELIERTQHRWHVNGDGSLCLFQTFSDWDPFATAADLVPKAAGWFLEYLLMKDRAVEAMTTAGIVLDDSLDHLFAPADS